MGAGRNWLGPRSPLPSSFYLFLTAHLHSYETLAAGARRGGPGDVRLRKGGSVPPLLALYTGRYSVLE
jgi:hypothetical protein